MKNIQDMQIIVIDVTNKCDRSCSNCTRFCGHYSKDKDYFMEQDYFEKALLSLKDFNGIVGVIGGEPTLHPQFKDLCGLMVKHFPDKSRRGLWTNKGGLYVQHDSLIQETFGYFNVNDHQSNKVMHTPILVSSDDLVAAGVMPNEERDNYVDNCWLQAKWSASINPRGAFFCEVAGALSMMFNGPKGWDIEKDLNWWKKTVPEYADQRSWACGKCGCAIPLMPRRSTCGTDDVSASNLERLKTVNSPKIQAGRYELTLGELNPDQPRNASWYFNRKNRY